MALSPFKAVAQTDEIQVYDASIAEPGVINLMWHNNFTPIGLTTPAFVGGITPDLSLNGVIEWAVGITPWFELGLYLPIYSISKNLGFTFNGFKLRTLFVEPNANDHIFVFGINFEFSFNSSNWEESRYSAEVRPIIGAHLGSFDLLFNPIIDTNYDGFGNLVFAPTTRIGYRISPALGIGVEHYADVGPFSNFLPLSQQSHQLFAVFDYSGMPFNVETGIGFGLTPGSDFITLKLMLSRDL